MIYIFDCLVSASLRNVFAPNVYGLGNHVVVQERMRRVAFSYILSVGHGCKRVPVCLLSLFELSAVS